MVLTTYVTGEKLWPDQGSNQGPSADHANTTTELIFKLPVNLTTITYNITFHLKPTLDTLIFNNF